MITITQCSILHKKTRIIDVMNAYDHLALFKAHRTREERAERNASGRGGGQFSQPFPLVCGEIFVRSSPREENIKHVSYNKISNMFDIFRQL